jgi:predicted DsbA family dithiol-disulfide isomerase
VFDDYTDDELVAIFCAMAKQSDYSVSQAVVDRFRLAVYRARFDDKADISDVDLLARLAGEVGADARGLASALADDTALTTGRTGLATARLT